MSLQSLVDDYKAREIKPKQQPASRQFTRAAKVWSTSIKNGITTKEADDIVTVEEVQFHVNSLSDSPRFIEADEFIERGAFDPSEPPDIEGKTPTDPMAELLKAEIKILAAPFKWAFKGLNFAFSPYNRGMKFLANAMLLDPLSKSAIGPIKRYAVASAIETENIRRVDQFRQKHNLEPSQPLPPEAIEKIRKETNDAASGLIKKANSEIEEIDVTVGDFGRSILDAAKALVPWPGVADDVRTFGEINADTFERMVGRDAPWYYAPIMDIAMDTLAMSGIMKMANASQTVESPALIARVAKLTKNERRAIKRAHKLLSKVEHEKVISSSVPTVNAAETAKLKLIKLVKEAKPLKTQKAKLLRVDRQEKAKKLLRVQKSIKGERLVRATKKALKGKAPLPDFTPLNTSLTAREIDTLFNMINTSNVRQGFDKGRAFLALDELLKGKIITKSQIANLEVVFGKGLTRALFRKQSIGGIIADLSFEVINLPRAFMASYDNSAPLRQGIIFSVSHPIASMKAFSRSIRAAVPFKGVKYTDDIERVTRNSKFGKMADMFGVHSSPTGFTAKIVGKEEVYMSRLAEKMPGVAQSERAFTTFLNQQRREVFAVQAKKWIKRGITPDKNSKSYEQLAKFINHGTGRGSFENMKPGTLTAMNALFFSPRFQVSRIQVIGDLIDPRTTKHVRKVVARDLAEFYITGRSVMAFARAGGAEVETDPRSSDYGKIKVGNTRYNYWGAFQPIATFIARIATGEIKSTATKKITKKPRLTLNQTEANIVRDFLRTKLAPVPGAAFDSFIGETVEGLPVEATSNFLTKATANLLAPLFIQDMVDALKFQEQDGQLPISAGLAFHGIGVQTWELAPFAELELARDSISRQTYGKDYDQLTWSEVTILDRDILVNHPGIGELEREARFESNSVNFLRKQGLDARKSERFVMKRVNKELLADFEEMKLRIGGVNREVGQWRLNDEQYKEYQEKTAKNINEIFESMRSIWDITNIDSYTKYEMASTILRRAKLKAANEMRIGEME